MFLRRAWPSMGAAQSILDPGRLLRDFERALDAFTRTGSAEPWSSVFPALNITRNPGHYRVRAELPGVQASQLTITTEGAKLSISGSREIPEEEGDVSYHRRERAAGSFSRTVVLPSEVDGEHVDARYEDGILTITLPIAESAKARQISVKTD